MKSTTTRNKDALDSTLIEIPEPPEVFGQDGGKFYQCYDKLARDIDDDMTDGLKERLDGLMLFAGLFAIINTLFLTSTLPLLWPSTEDDLAALTMRTNAILLQIAIGLNSTLVPIHPDLPSAYFTTSVEAVIVNMLFSLSLTFGLISSLLAMLGRQWLFYYSKRGSGGSDRQRWAQLQRYLGARRWRLEIILDDIVPAILQIGIIIFYVSFITYLHILAPVVSAVVSIPLFLALVIFVGSGLCKAWDRFCPFESSLSHSMQWIYHKFSIITPAIIPLPKAFVSLFGPLDHPSAASSPCYTPVRATNEIQQNPPLNSSLAPLAWSQKGETLESLEVIALQRAICTSEDPITHLYAVANIPAINDPMHVRILWDDQEFQERLLELYKGSLDRTTRLLGRDQPERAVAVKRLYAAAVTHILLYIDHDRYDDVDRLLMYLRDVECFKTFGAQTPERIPHDLSPVFVRTSLAHAVISIIQFPPSSTDIKNLCNRLNFLSDPSLAPDWRLFSLVSWVIAKLPKITSLYKSDLDSLAKAFRGDVDIALEAINQAFGIISAGNDVYNLNFDGALINLLRLSSQVVTDECPHPDMGMEQTLVLLRCAEKSLRSASDSSELRPLVEKMRDKVAPIFKKTCVREHSLWTEITTISTEILDTLISLFQALTETSRAQSSKDEDIQTLRAFSPLLDNVLSPETVFEWDGVEYYPDERPTSLVRRLDMLRQVLNQFTPN